MAIHREFLDRAERIYKQPASDLQGLRNQIKTLAEVVMEIGKHQRRFQDDVTESFRELFALLKSRSKKR